MIYLRLCFALFLIESFPFAALGFVPFNGQAVGYLPGYITVSDSLIDFGDCYEDDIETRVCRLFNGSDESIDLDQAYSCIGEFVAGGLPLLLPARDSVELELTFTPRHNVEYHDFLVIENSGCDRSFSIKLSASGRYTDIRYDGTWNLYDEELKDALLEVVDNHTVLGYDNARIAIFGYIDNMDGWVECVYTGDLVEVEAGGVPDWDIMNTEHTWPQSMFEGGTPKSDIHHLFPTMAEANNKRGNYPFGEVISNIVWQDGGSRLGEDEFGSTVFEPRDSHKGDVARSMFYFTIRYGNQSSFLDYQEDTLREWYYSDEVSTGEQDRNEEIASRQEKPNPFIDHPEYLERISNLSDTAVTEAAPDIHCSPYLIHFTKKDSGDYHLMLMNTGNGTLEFVRIESDSEYFEVVSSPDTVSSFGYNRASIRFHPEEGITFYQGTLTVESNDPDDGVLEIGLDADLSPSGIELPGITGKPSVVRIIAYPNPFNPKTTIRFELPGAGLTVIELFDLSGMKVRTLLASLLQAGNHGLNFDGTGVAAGVYLCRLSHPSGTATVRIVLLK